MLMKHLGADKWSVIMEDGDGSSQVMSGKSLQRLCDAPPRTYSIAGSWDDWEVHAMTWDAESWCFQYEARLGSGGYENFKFLLEGDWDRCVYPDRFWARPGDGHEIRGPDAGTAGDLTVGDWVLGGPGDRRAVEGSRYRVRLSLLEGGDPAGVTWELLPGPRAPEPAQKEEQRRPSYSIVGSWDDWESHDMAWDAASRCYVHPVALDADGYASFRFLLEGDWERCVYPDRPDAAPGDGHRLLGPDDGGDLGEWTIKGQAGSRWQIMFSVADGRAGEVRWKRCTEAQQGAPEEPAPQGPSLDLDDVLAEVCPRGAGAARAELAGMGIQEAEELKEAIAGPLGRRCRAALGEEAVRALLAHFGLKRPPA